MSGPVGADLIVGTAGHIDHGKTSLLRALTGIDLDALPEEQRRGITIALGFTALGLADGRTAAFVDVPGHERLVRTMVAGATGVDAVLLCVSALDGVMPQTREHLAILELHVSRVLWMNAFDYTCVLGDPPELQSQTLQLFEHFFITTAGGS